MEELILVFSGPEMSAVIVKTILNDHDIECVVKNESESARLAGFGAVKDSKVYVLASDVEAANLWIKEFKNAG